MRQPAEMTEAARPAVRRFRWIARTLLDERALVKRVAHPFRDAVSFVQHSAGQRCARSHGAGQTLPRTSGCGTAVAGAWRVGHDGAVRATITDVSRAAGVSIKTVSRVLNNERYVGAATAERVRAAIAALDFRPSLAARSLAGKRSHQIALICDNPSPWYVFEMQSGVRDRCEMAGVRMIAQPWDRAAGGLAGDVAALLDATSADGVVLTPPASDRADVLDLLDARGVPYVRVSPGTRPEASPATGIDNEAAAHAMTAHLVALGHRRIGFVGGHPDYAASAQRAAGFARALAEAGIAPDPELRAPGFYDFASGEAAGGAMLALSEPPSAIFAANDEMAAGVLVAAHRAGVAVPERLSVAGFGDDALAQIVWPPLTTIRQPVRALAWNAADLLLAPSDGPQRRVVEWELVERASTGPRETRT